MYASDAHATEKMVPTIEGEFARKRRMMSHSWPIVLRGGMLSPRGYDPLYALMIVSHRILRYLTPFLHVIALVASIVLLGQGWVYAVALAIQVAILLAAVARAASSARGRSWSPATTCSRRRRWRPGCGTGCARHGRRLGARGGHPVSALASAVRRALDLVVAGSASSA